MTRYTFVSTLVFVLASAVSALTAQAGYCDFPPKALLEGDRREYKGLYENKAHGYAVVVPSGLVGYDDANPVYQRGFGIILGDAPHSYLFVDGQANSLEFSHPEQAASAFVEYLGESTKVTSSRITATQLGRLRAARLVVTYMCPDSAQYVRASVVAISRDKGELYQVTLYSRPDRFEHDRIVLDEMVSSWKDLKTRSGARRRTGSREKKMM